MSSSRSLGNAVLGCIIVAAALVLSSSRVVAGPITFFGSSGNLKASVLFDTSGNNLIVTLTNTSMADVLVPSDVLTAVFFDITGNPTLTRIEAKLAPGRPTDPGGVVGGEWAYKTGLAGEPPGTMQGISSVGLGPFGPADLFPGNDLQPPTSPDGLQYGITSAGDNPLTGNTPVTGTNALIQNSVIFTLGGLPANFDPSTAISNVKFQYGTNFSEPRIPGDPVPEPASLLLLGSGALGAGWLRWRRGAKR
jgi:hypothetical protein